MNSALSSYRVRAGSSWLLAFAAAALLAAPSFAQLPRDLPAEVSVDAPLRHLDHSVVARKLAPEPPSGERTMSLFVEGPVATSALEAIGARVQTDAGGIRTVRVSESALAALVGLPGVRRLSLGYPLTLHHNLSIPETRADDKRTQQPPLAGWNGNGVIVGVVDTGIDYDHEDFKKPDGSTRILSIWDQNTGGSPPSGFAYGNECSQAQIDAGTCSEVDFDGHGSHVTGSAAGDGSATGNGEPAFRYVGMANDADIIMVATNFSTAGVVDAVNYIFGRAASLGKPAVVNLSLGTDLGPHDGTLSLETQLNALVGPGKIVVTSAGNAQDDDSHGSADISASADSFRIAVGGYFENAGAGNDFIAIDAWHDASNSYDVTVRTPGGIVVGPVSKGSSTSASTAGGRVIIDYTGTIFSNGMSNVYVEMNDDAGTPPQSGNWQLAFHPVNVPDDPKVHAWMIADLGTTVLPAFPTFATHLDTTTNVGSPGNADSVITVAAYTSRRFWTAVDQNTYQFSGSVDPPLIAPFSARGPTRTGGEKPDITAPGTAIISVLSGDASPPYPDPLIAQDGKHLVLQGTSMSSPHVAGAAAMILQAEPGLGPAAMKARLFSGARTDGITGTTWNARWGHGRLDLTSLLCDLDLVPPTASLNFPVAPETLYSGTQVAIGWNASDNEGVTSVTIEWRDGTLGSWNVIASETENDGTENFTVPAIVTDSLEVRVTAVDCLSNEGFGSSGFVSVRAASVDVGDELPLAFAAYGPSPNPFSQNAAIRFDLPSAPGATWPVEVNLYNVAGRKVRTLVSGELAPGRYSYDWNGRDDAGVRLSAGVYFLQVQAGPNVARHRVVFLR